MENVVSVLFKVRSEAYQAFSELKGNLITNDYSIKQMALLQKENGRLVSRDGIDSGLNTTDDTRKGGLIGLLIGVWTGPIGMLLCTSTGALIGSINDSEDAKENVSLMESVGSKLEEGDLALVLLVDERIESSLNDRLYHFDTDISRREANEVRQEIEDAANLEKKLAKEAKKQSREDRKKALKEKFKFKKKKE